MRVTTATTTAVAILGVVAACLVAVASAQSLQSVISAKETSLLNLASQGTAQYQSRCTALTSCSTAADSCAVPACGNGFDGRFGFDCTTSFGANTGLCGSTCPGLVRSMNTSVVRFPDGVSMTDGETQAFACSSRRMDSHFVSQNSTLRAWQYIGHDSGSIRIYPGNAQERSNGRCGDYDARLRPWYTAASSGPKDIVIVIDRSGSMLNDNVPGQPNRGTRMAATISATKALLGTLTPNDNVGVVTFSSAAQALGGFTSLVRATNANVATLSTAVDGVFADGGTAFNTGFTKAFDLITGTTEDTNCNRVILFLTDGAAAEEEASILSTIATRQAQLPRPAHIFTYSMSSASEDAKPRAIACANQGVWSKIADGVDPLTKMRSYFQFLASGMSSTTVRWTAPYEDAFGLGQMVTASLPVYTSSAGVRTLVGVMGADVTMAELQAFGDSASTVLGQLYLRGRTCTVFSLSECQMQYLRQQSSESYVCPTPKPAIASCDANNEIVRRSACSSITGGLNGVLCESISQSTRLASTETPLTNAEASCCNCNGAGNGRVGASFESASSGSGSSSSSDDGGSGSTTVIIVVVVVVVVVIIAIIGAVVFKMKSGAATTNEATQAGHQETELERRRRERQEEQAQKMGNSANPGYPPQSGNPYPQQQQGHHYPAQVHPAVQPTNNNAYPGYPPQQGQPQNGAGGPQQATYV